VLRLAIGLAGVCLVVAAGSAEAQVFGVWSNPRPVASDAWVASGHFLLGEPIGLMGQVRTGLDERSDVGIQLGIPDFDLIDFAVAGDYRYLLSEAGESLPMDMLLDVAFGWQTGDFWDVVDFDFGAIFTKDMQTSGGTSYTPYGSLMFAIGRFSVDVPEIPGIPGVFEGSASDTEFDINLRGGVAVPFDQFDLNAELNISSREEFIFFTVGASTPLN
jgi:hypothetical protein